MFDCNKFKRAVKDWMQLNPNGSVDELMEFCEELIPPQQYTAHQWLVEQTTSWYKHVLSQRDAQKRYRHDEEDATH
jgi:hypothetical protein